MNKLVAQTMAKKENGEKGFTLIELLVVVIIIGILAAIAIPIFLNMRQGAWKSSVESDVTNAVSVVEQATAANNGSLNGLTFDVPTTDGPSKFTAKKGATVVATGTISDGNKLVITPNATANTYVIKGTNKDLGVGNENTYTYSSENGSGDWNATAPTAPTTP